MRAGGSQLKTAVVVIIIQLWFYNSCQSDSLQVCNVCNGTVLANSSLGLFCASASGRVAARCCLRHDNSSQPEDVIGLDLSNCSLNHIEDLQGASRAVMIDLSFNPITTLNDVIFQGFIELNYLALPPNLVCPGGNASWETVELNEGSRVCQRQKSMCNQTGQLSMSCPENSLCSPFGPGFYECSCDDNFYGYKCLREGVFPVAQVFGPLGASTLLLSILLWVTQRRKVQSV